MNTPLIIAIAGGSGSGKTTLAKKLMQKMDAILLGQDSYYIDQSSKFDRDGGAVNFDDPASLELTLLAEHLTQLRTNHAVNIPIYDFATHKRQSKTEVIHSHPVILVDGTLILSQAILLPLFDVSIFLEVDEDTRFQRRLKRDVNERGRTPEGVRAQFFTQVKPMHDLYVEPSKQNASIIIRNGNAIDVKNDNSPAQNQMLTIVRSLI